MARGDERDCPKCGDTTTEHERSGTNLRTCDNEKCNWAVEISGTGIAGGMTRDFL
jgi:ribosomal protein L37AE/L43A